MQMANERCLGSSKKMCGYVIIINPFQDGGRYHIETSPLFYKEMRRIA